MFLFALRLTIASAMALSAFAVAGPVPADSRYIFREMPDGSLVGEPIPSERGEMGQEQSLRSPLYGIQLA
jgi:hypothetical protein